MLFSKLSSFSAIALFAASTIAAPISYNISNFDGDEPATIPYFDDYFDANTDGYGDFDKSYESELKEALSGLDDAQIDSIYNETSALSVESSGIAPGSDHVFYLLASGFCVDHSDYKDYINIQTQNIYNNHLAYEDITRKVEDTIVHNDMYGIGMAASGACCSKTYGSFGQPGLNFVSVKIFTFQGRSDPTAIKRGFDYIADDIIKNKHKKSTILYAAPQRKFYHAYINGINKIVNKFGERITEEHPEHDYLVMLPAGDFDWNLDESHFKETYQALTANPHVLTVGSRDQRFKTQLLKTLLSNYGSTDVVGLYGPGFMIPTWNKVPNSYHRSRPEKNHMNYGTTMATSVLSGMVAREFVNTDKTSFQIKQELLDAYAGKVEGIGEYY